MAELEKRLKQIEQNFREAAKRHPATEDMDENICRKRPTRQRETKEPDTIPDTYDEKTTDQTNPTNKRAKVLKNGRTDDTQTPTLNPNPDNLTISEFELRRDHSELEQIVIPGANHKTGAAGSAKLVVHKDDMGYLLDYYF